MKTLVIFLFLTPFLVSGEYADQTINQVGLWNVTTCIKANFSMNFTFVLTNYEPPIPVTVYVPKDAEVDDFASKCGNGNEDQVLALKWKDDAKNNTELDRSITISFKKNETLGLYGVSHLYGTFQMAKWEVNVTDDTTNTTITVPYNSTVYVDSNEIKNIMFHTPLGKSFTCKDIGDFSLVTKIKYKPTAYNIDLQNATIETGHLHFDAFRPNTSDPLVWRDALDCDYAPNDIVPIVVGVALATLVIAVLIAYMVGRRRNRLRGYQSV